MGRFKYMTLTYFMNVWICGIEKIVLYLKKIILSRI